MFTFSQFVDALIKGHGHRYIKRIPYMTPKGRRYRYIYKVTHSHKGKQAIHEDHLDVGTKFMLHTESGKEVHGHIKSVKGDKVTYVIDDGADKGKEVTGTKAEILAMLNERHGVEEQLQEKRDQLKADIEQAKKTGTEKQVARLEAQLKKLGGEPAKEGAVTVQEDPERKIKRLKTIIEYANKVQHYILDNKTMDHKGVSRALDRLNDQYMSDDYRNIFLIDEVLAMRPPAPKIDINKIIKDAKKELKQAEKDLKTSKKKPAKAKPAKAKPAKAKPAKAKPVKAIDYAKAFKTAPKSLPPVPKLDDKMFDLIRHNMFDVSQGAKFFKEVFNLLIVDKKLRNEFGDLADEFQTYARNEVHSLDHNVFKDTGTSIYNNFDIRRFATNEHLFTGKPKKIKQGTVVEYPFKELHEKGLGFGFVHDFKTNKTGLGFFVKKGMFQGNAFIMSPCDKKNALWHLSTMLTKLNDIKINDTKKPFSYLRSVDSFAELSNQLKEMSLIVDDNGDFSDEIARNRLVEDYGEDWVAQVEYDANEANALMDQQLNGEVEDFGEQVSAMKSDYEEAEESALFVNMMSAVAPIYSEIESHLQKTTEDYEDSDVVYSLSSLDPKAVTLKDKAKKALEDVIKKTKYNKHL